MEVEVDLLLNKYVNERASSRVPKLVLIRESRETHPFLRPLTMLFVLVLAAIGIVQVAASPVQVPLHSEISLNRK